MTKSEDNRADAPARRAIWQWYRLAATSLSLLFLALGVAACVINLVDPRPLDFLSFWAAGRLALDGQAALAYDVEAHRAVERLAVHIAGLLPFPYPPVFLLVVAPFAFVPYQPAFILWVAVTSLFLAWAGAKFSEWRYALSNPLLVPNLLIGQNGALIAGIFGIGLALLPSAPFMAGAILGTLVIKPQLALLLPVAMLAGRQWQAILGGATSAVVLIAIAALVFGTDSFGAFFGLLPAYAGFLADSRWPWAELASPFALARYLGLTNGIALAVHAVAAATAVGVTARAWWTKSDERIPILAAGTLLIPPYILTYDALLLFIPIAWLIQRKRQPGSIALIWLLSFWPVAGYFGAAGPNTVPLAALLCLWVLTRPDGQTTTLRAADPGSIVEPGC